jgi:cell division protein FtsB
VGIDVSNGHKILLSLVTLVLLNILLVIIFGDRGLVEVSRLKGERERLLRDNHDLNQKNLSLRREIERLKTDPVYIEHVARQELGMIGRDEVIVRFNSPENKVPKSPEKDKQP